jgi:dienelactone hydrolase
MRLRALVLPAVLAAASLIVAAPAAQASAPDPAVAGSHAVTTYEYDAGPTTVSDPSDGLTYQEELQGALYVPDGAGPFPVLLFLHGRHDTCTYAGLQDWVGPPQVCQDGALTKNIRSYQGYAYLATNLASHGYLVMSVSANAINSFDLVGDSGAEERAQVIARSLDKLYDWNAAAGPAPVGSSLVGRVDLSRIGLMGHSRGGEGVDHFVAYNRRRTDGRRYPGLTAVFALAPTDFAGEAPYGVHYATLLPLCDGDVYDLEGSWAYDRGRFVDPNETHSRAQYTLTGANHNWFNTVWDIDDYSGSDPACDTTNPANVRLTHADQRDAGLAIMASFFRRWVGGETAFDALVKGAEPLPASACPGAAATCPTLVRTSYLAPAADRRLLVQPGNAASATGFATYTTCTPTTSGTGCPTNPERSIATQLTLGWTGPATLTTTAPGDVSSLAALTFRTGVNYDDARNTGTAQDLDVTLTDTAGATATVNAAAYTASLRKPPGGADRELTLDGVWIPLTAFGGVDLTHVASVKLGFGVRTASGSIQLAELGFQK